MPRNRIDTEVPVCELVKGGQGRSAEDLLTDAIVWIKLAIVAAVIVGAAITIAMTR